MLNIELLRLKNLTVFFVVYFYFNKLVLILKPTFRIIVLTPILAFEFNITILIVFFRVFCFGFVLDSCYIFVFLQTFTFYFFYKTNRHLCTTIHRYERVF